MEAWLLALIAAIPQPFRAAAALVINAIIRLFQWTDGLARRVRGGWNPITAAAQWLSQGLLSLGNDMWTTLRWIILIKIPMWANHAMTVAINWASARINELHNWAQSIVDNVFRWTVTQIQGVLSTLDGLRKWASGLLAEARAAINRLLSRVFDTWATPARLAEWIVGAMWTALWRYAWSQADRIAAALWAARRTLALRTVSEIERIIGRLL